MASFAGNALDALRQWLTQGDTVDPATTGPNLGTVALSGTVDTELPVAGSVTSQATAGLTIPIAGALGMVRDNGGANIVGLQHITESDTLVANQTSIPVRPRSLVYNGASWERHRTPNIFKAHVATAIATEATVWTPAAGKKFRLMGGVITSAAAGDIVFRDNTAGTTIAVIPVLAGAPITFDFQNGILSAAANNVLTADGPALATLSGTLFGTEE